MREILILLAALSGTNILQPSEPTAVTQDAILFEPVDRNEYVLSAGDVLQVTIAGGCTPMMITSGLMPQSICMVSGDGHLPVSGLGQIDVDGLSIAEAEDRLLLLARSFYPRISLGIALLEPRHVKVYIGGMVESPGTYTLSAISRISDLVVDAGGLTSYSSRMGSMFLEIGDTVSVDLRLDPLTHRRTADPFVSNNASVFFELCSDPLYILRGGGQPVLQGENMVSSVETWNVDPDTDLQELIEQIGGLGGNMDLERSLLIHGSEQYPLWSNEDGLLDIVVSPGDTLSLVMLSDSISVGGAVNNSIRVAFRPGITAREYVDISGGIRSDGDMGRTKVFRNGEEIARGSEALALVLLPGDVIEVPWTWIARNADWIRLLSTVMTIVVMVDGLTN
jgi:protein involved in polysaccharide export with SLBB domain